MKGTSWMDSAKAQEEESPLREMCTKECLWLIKWKERECTSFLMEEFMRENSYRAGSMARAGTSGQMDKFMMEILKQINVLVLESSTTPMEKDLKEIGRMAKKVARELTYFQMAPLIVLSTKEARRQGKLKWKRVLKTLRI